MAFLNGHEVRTRAAELAPRGLSYTPPADGLREAQAHFSWLADRTGIPVGTIHNATRDNPQPISLPRVYDLAAHLCRSGEDVRDVVAAITAGDDQPKPTPEKPKEERPRDPSAPPPRRNGKGNNRRPRADSDVRGAA